MASDRAESEVKVTASGELYLIQIGDAGRLIDTTTGWAGGVASVQSILAHSQVIETWRPIPEAAWPDAVRSVAREMLESPPRLPPLDGPAKPW
jgi:hypothetical protein